MTEADCCGSLAWFKVATAMLPVAASLLTWKITQNRTLRSERRREAREDKKVISDRLDALQELAFQFHCGANYDENLAPDITSKLHILTGDLGRVTMLSGIEYVWRAIDLRQAITLTNFDASRFQQKDVKDAFLVKIVTACDAIKELVNSRYLELYG